VKAESRLTQNLGRASVKFYSQNAMSVQLVSGEKNMEKNCVRSVSVQHLVEFFKKCKECVRRFLEKYLSSRMQGRRHRYETSRRKRL
jgi:hypothetical protein